MQFTKLRLTGFKSFVEPTDFVIESGLTGLIGPNGCGKSNLVEALRWVMGETSYKSMRASGMDDVIFAGGGDRPSRNHAEVTLTLDNSARGAPAAFNDTDVLEVSRRIERAQGSTYRINGREVRARDVQILFADAATGARSPSLVRQGQVSEVIAAKPQARRRILEDAAGVAGLHARRHEAELRLKAAEDNLARIDDVLSQISGHGEALRRQARHAQRYREVQAEIRRHHALLFLVEYETASRDQKEASQAADASARHVEEAARVQGEAARGQALAAQALPALREAEATAGRSLQRLLVARETLDGEERRLKGRLTDLDRRLKDMAAEGDRDAAALADADAVMERLHREDAELRGTVVEVGDEGSLATAAETARAAVVALEATLVKAQAERAERDARHRAAAAALKEEDLRLGRLTREADAAAATLAACLSAILPSATLDDAERRLRAAEEAQHRADGRGAAADQAAASALEAEAESRGPLADASRRLDRLETEIRTLTKLLDAESSEWPRLIDAIEAAPGYETALGAVLGEDLEASTDRQAPCHWLEGSPAGDAPLPATARPLAIHVAAPPVLHRRLSQIGVVDTAILGEALACALTAGQCLVTLQGDVWRWDGLRRRAGTPTSAARRLAERTRLADLRQQVAKAQDAHRQAEAAAEAAQIGMQTAKAHQGTVRTEMLAARRAHDGAREAYADLQRRQSGAQAKADACRVTREAAAAVRDESILRHHDLTATLKGLEPSGASDSTIDVARDALAAARRRELDALAALTTMRRMEEARTRRLAAIAEDRAMWMSRRDEASAHRLLLERRMAEAVTERAALLENPDRFVAARRTLVAEADAAEAGLRQAGDARASGERALAEADGIARKSLDALAAAREVRARNAAMAEAALQRVGSLKHQVAVELDCLPDDLAALAGAPPGAERPSMAEVAARLDGLKTDRDRLGPVNLRAEEELSELEGRRSRLDSERRELTEAIRRLRLAIGGLNREGRDRLLSAFRKVDEHFRSLFTLLFDGGTAELQLVESDDPLDAGLEILARPPGKKPQVMTLLSGGEQALTAISLIFAVFLTNPSPICVLDEVDAPLDDANVERFCDLVDATRRKTQTRFIAITHNPIAMARMDRLYGVTQAEPGISQLVSMDLGDAKRMLEASEMASGSTADLTL